LGGRFMVGVHPFGCLFWEWDEEGELEIDFASQD
jgi:hypothetical protein